MEEEVWKDVNGWNGKYQISNHGRLKSINGKFSISCPDGYVTLGTIDDKGYRAIQMRRPGYKERFRVHTLVGKHFIEKPIAEKRLVVNHKDGNKMNNYFKNLEWVTDAKNSEHAVKMGLFNLKGENHPHVKLTKELRHKENWTHQKIADKFFISRRQAGDVINGINWGWLKEGLLPRRD